MPRVNLGRTPQQKMQDAKERQDKRVKRIFSQGMAKREYNAKTLSAVTMIPYQRVVRMLNGSTTLDLWSATVIADALGLDDETRSAICGGAKCKFD